MEHAEYVERARQAAELVGAGAHGAAAAAFRDLAGDASLPDVDRSIMWANAAVCADRDGEGDAAVLGCFEAGAALERLWMRHLTRLQLAAWLAGRERWAEAAAVHREVLAGGWLTWAERAQVAADLEVASSRAQP